MYKAEDFDRHLKHGLEVSPIHEVMIDKAMMGWKEYELELLRDNNDNVVIICTIENMDPMGIHTGDSITVAPAMTLSDVTFQRHAICTSYDAKHWKLCRGCNVQFAVSPDEKEDIIAIEINPRVSCSSALASTLQGILLQRLQQNWLSGTTWMSQTTKLLNLLRPYLSSHWTT
ncbi:MAG: hypothetical protein R2773_02780 [Flavobacteriaceae bacterium]